jgi:hypothetical protein
MSKEVECCERANEPSGSIKGKEFLGWLKNCQFQKKDSADSVLWN